MVPRDISIRGFIKAERHASPHILKIISEILQNSMEANRLARNHGADRTTIIVEFRFDDAHSLRSMHVTDYASCGSGINDISNKHIFSLYNHIGDSDGFSEFGIGGKQSCMQLGDVVSYATNTGQDGGTLTWNIANAIMTDDHFGSIVFSSEVLSIPSPYQTGTQVRISDIVPKFKSTSVGTYLLSRGQDDENYENFQEDICSSFVKIEEKEEVIFRFNKSGVYQTHLEFKLVPKSNLMQHHEEHQLVVVRNSDKYDTYLKHNNMYYKYYSDQKRNRFTTGNLYKDPKLSLPNSSHIVGDAILHLSTDTESTDIAQMHPLMGYDAHRRVSGGSVVKTNLTPLRLQWNLFSSHRTRYVQFRGAIEYDKRLDSIVQTDKCKTVSDDRAFERSFNYTILHLTSDYLNRMKKEGHYNADKKEATVEAETEEFNETHNSKSETDTNVSSQICCDAETIITDTGIVSDSHLDTDPDTHDDIPNVCTEPSDSLTISHHDHTYTMLDEEHSLSEDATSCDSYETTAEEASHIDTITKTVLPKCSTEQYINKSVDFEAYQQDNSPTTSTVSRLQLVELIEQPIALEGYEPHEATTNNDESTISAQTSHVMLQSRIEQALHYERNIVELLACDIHIRIARLEQIGECDTVDYLKTLEAFYAKLVSMKTTKI